MFRLSMEYILKFSCPFVNLKVELNTSKFPNSLASVLLSLRVLNENVFDAFFNLKSYISCGSPLVWFNILFLYLVKITSFRLCFSGYIC